MSNEVFYKLLAMDLETTEKAKLVWEDMEKLIFERNRLKEENIKLKEENTRLKEARNGL
jgi:hypothetical protein